MSLKTEENNISLEEDPFDLLRAIIDTFNTEGLYGERQEGKTPFQSGLMGYLAYDLKDSLESLPRTTVDKYKLPHICLFAPSAIVVHDRSDKSTRLFVPERICSGKNMLRHDLDSFHKILETDRIEPEPFSTDSEEFRSDFTRADYRDAVEKIKEYISSGHVYQVCMSQCFEIGFQGDPFSLFKALYEKNPAPFFSYINAGNHRIVSTSPERFILQQGKSVETRPIKGTKPRGKTEEEDRELRQELEQSAKEDAELSMIVDLLRNDIGKVCEAGSVKVTQHKRLEAYQNVYHLVSIVNGRLDRGRDSVDLIKATFPGGSITGCPKIRAMEIIDEMEPCRRHIYTGSIGYISFHDTMDLSIAIRTGTIHNGRFVFSVGGGIVFDSDPDEEFDETLHKGRTLMDVFKERKSEQAKIDYVWINGLIKRLDQAGISIADKGFLYGYGFFETIRADAGKLRLLKEHMERFCSTWEQLFETDPPDLTWEEIIQQVLTANHLEDETAAVKIIASFGDRDAPPFNHTLVVTARPYRHRLADKTEPGLHLAAYPSPRQTPLADHKTMNYLYYLMAGKWAKAQGADEALITNPDGSISETNTANILLIKDRAVITPISMHVLPGIMEKEICRLLSEWDYRLESRRIFPEDLFSMDQVIVTNSLMGAVPVLWIDGKRLKQASNLWQKISNEVL